MQVFLDDEMRVFNKPLEPLKVNSCRRYEQGGNSGGGQHSKVLVKWLVPATVERKGIDIMRTIVGD